MIPAEVFLRLSSDTQLSNAVKFNMADWVHRLSLTASEPKRGKKKGKNKNSAEYMADLALMVKNNEKKKTKPTEMVFKRDPITGERRYHSGYRPRSTSRKAKFSGRASKPSTSHADGNNTASTL